MAEVPDDQLSAWADQVHVAASWVSGPHRKKMMALAAEITAWASPTPQGDGEQTPGPEAPSLAAGTGNDGEDLLDEQ